MMRTSVFTSFLLFSTLAYAFMPAQQISFPPGCQLMQNALVDGELQLSNDSAAKQPQLIMVQNIAEHPIWLVSLDAQGVALAGQVQPSKWTALVLADKKIRFGCIESRPGSEQYMACEDALQVCGYDTVSFPGTITESYWLAQDRQLLDILSHISAHGIVVPSLIMALPTSAG